MTMKRKFVIRIPAIALMLFLAHAVSHAQTEAERVRFERGKNSATISAAISAGQQRTYTLYVKKGQKITIKVTSDNNRVDLDAKNVSAGQFEEAGHQSLSLPIDETGDYQVYVRNRAKTATHFRLTITVR